MKVAKDENGNDRFRVWRKNDVITLEAIENNKTVTIRMNDGDADLLCEMLTESLSDEQLLIGFDGVSFRVRRFADLR